MWKNHLDRSKRSIAQFLVIAAGLGLMVYGVAGALSAPGTVQERGFASPHVASPSGGSHATPGSSACPQMTVTYDQTALRGGQGSEDFTLDATCNVQATLSTRLMAGTLKVWIDGPTGRVFERALQGASAPLVRVGVDGSGGSEGGPWPAGAYAWGFEASSAAWFELRIETR
jgi:hypothetical protein